MEPGLVQHKMGQGLIIGEPGGGKAGSEAARVQRIGGLLKDAGFEVTLSARIRDDIWYKLWGNLTMNPVSAITGATIDRVLDDPLVYAFCSAAMREAAAVGEAIGCPLAQSPEDRHAVTRKLGAFQALVDRYGYKTSLYGHFGDGCVHARITSGFFQPRRSRLPASGRALHRHGTPPLAQGKYHVPELQGHARGTFLDARPRTPAVGNAARRSHPGRLEKRSRERSARYLPVLQGMPQRLPHAYRHGGVQGGVPVALLRRAAQAAAGADDGTHRRVGAAGGEAALAGQLPDAPGCMSVFKDELRKQFPSDPRADYLAKNTWLLGDFLVAQNYSPPPFAADVLVHEHCHQKALFGTKGDQELLRRMGAEHRTLDSGCCGMAGSFGFSPEHAELSMAIGEQVLLPAVRKAAASTFILTNGFSCREQIEQGAGRKAVHLAELLDAAIRAEVH